MSERKSCPNHDVNQTMCSCPKAECPRHGYCCQCVEHMMKEGKLPQCYTKAGF